MMDPLRAQDWEHLRSTIAQWNSDRLDLFELSEPDEDLKFHGVMRFYYQDSGEKVSTKCIRVSSDQTAQDVIDILVEKFRPDMRMLSTPRYALYEIHESGEERQLGLEQRPLHVQLNWHHDDREGRFLLRNLNQRYIPLRPAADACLEDGNFQRKLSKREKKHLKKKGKLQKMKSGTGESVAEKLYTELPETSFTRSISNPEAVMRRRREQKLEKKLQQFRSRNGGPDTGGTLKIYGESLCSDVPYKTLLLSVTDSAAAVVREMLLKYGLPRADPAHYCLVQVVTQEPQPESREYRAPTGPYSEHVLEEEECPLSILINHPPTTGSIMFHVRKRTHDSQPRKRKKMPSSSGSGPLGAGPESEAAPLPFLVELNSDGSEIRHTAPRRYSLRLNVTEVGSERSPQAGGQCLQLTGENVHPRHCVIAHTEGIVTVTPCGREAETYVNGQRVYETTILQHGCVVQFGRGHQFRFLDPTHDERLRTRPPSRHDLSQRDITSVGGMGPRQDSMETTFDVTGNVETRSTASHRNNRDREDAMSTRSDARSGNYASVRRVGSDPILPAVLEFREDTEDALLHAVISRIEPDSVQFKLAPTYTLYMAARFRASTHYRSDLSPNERAVRLTSVLAKVASLVRDCIQMRRQDTTALAFWMANASEYLHFLKQDRHIGAYSRQAQDILAESVQSAFWSLVDNVQAELSGRVGGFLADCDEGDDEEAATGAVLATLANTMSLLRRCRVNAALTIQLFSQLFHYINMALFNMLVLPGPVNYCSRLWGERLRRRLGRTEIWADRQGLELAADCHLGRVVQGAHLLTAPKNNVDDLTGITGTCYRLNSLQLRAMLERYQPGEAEPARIPPQLVDNIVRIAETTSDELARQDGRPVQLEESRDLQLPFLLPEDGYSSDIVRGIPNGLSEFISPLQHAGLARMSEQPTSWGYWTIYMAGHDHSKLQPRSPSAMSNRSVGARAPPPGTAGPQPQLQTIRLHKSNTGLGLSIVAAKGVGQDQQGIYVKSVVRGGAADADGRLAAGDMLLEVDGQSLVGITQEQAAEYMMCTGPVVVLRVAKQAAAYHRLTTMLSQPSPTMSRGPRRASERANMPPTGRIQNSKSVPTLSGDGEHGPASPGRHRDGPPPGYNLSASHASLATPPSWQSPPAAHVRSRSVQNLHRPLPAPAAAPTATGVGGPAPPARPLSVHNHQPPPPAMAAARSDISRSVPEHEQLRYRPPSTGLGPPEPSAGSSSGGDELRPHLHHQNHGPYHSRTHGHMGSSSVLAESGYSGQNGGVAGQPAPGLGRELGNGPGASAEPSNAQQRFSHSEYAGTAASQPEYSQGDQFRHDDGEFNCADSQSGQLRNGQPELRHSGADFRNGPDFRENHAGLHGEGGFQQTLAAEFRSEAGFQHPAAAEFRNEAGFQHPAAAEFRNEAGFQHPAAAEFRNEAGFQHPAAAELRNEAGFQHPAAAEFRNEAGFQHPAAAEFRNETGFQRPAAAEFRNETGFQHPAAAEFSQGEYRAGQDMECSDTTHADYGDKRAAAEDPPPARPPLPEDGYGDLPPPPPPPSTHPLYGQGSPSRPSAAPSQQSLNNPWNREEREQEAARRQTAARHWRDEHITRLQALQPRSRRQQQQLDTLLLEKRFQERMELGGDDEDGDEQSEQEPPPVSAEPPRPPPPADLTVIAGPDDASRLSPSARQQEVLRRQAELEAAHQAEQGILREAQRRRDEVEAAHLAEQGMLREAQRRRDEVEVAHQAEQGMLREAQRRRDELEAGHQAEQGMLREAQRRRDEVEAAHQAEQGILREAQRRREEVEAVRVQPHPQPPPAPGRTVSWGAVTSSVDMRPPAVPPRPEVARASVVSTRRVQLSTDRQPQPEPPQQPPPPPPPREDPDRFLDEAEQLMGGTGSVSPPVAGQPPADPSWTPGVIGAQEVYRDPRTRRLAQLQDRQKPDTSPVPEKLSFKEKMRMFAAETS